jgi:small-conductance mechanosensitive channel
MKYLDTEFAGVTLQNWLLGAAVAVGVFIALRIARAVLVSRLGKLTKRTSVQWDDAVVAALRKTNAVFLGIVSVYIAAAFFVPEGTIRGFLSAVAVFALIVQGGIWASAAIASWLKSYRERKLDSDAGAVTTMGLIGFTARVAVWSGVLLLVLDNLGIKITTLLAGLGVGGIAVALAVQKILSDLFASLSIALDKPFVVGDFLIVDDLLGSVERIGLKTTRIRSLSGEQLVFSNDDLLKSRLRNFGRMYERRVVFTIGVTYQTPRRLLAQIPTMIREAVESQEKTRFDRSHFKAYGDFSLDFETVYYVLAADYNLYMDIQQAINLRIHEAFEREKIDFAYPTRLVYLAPAENDDGNVRHEVRVERSPE